MAGIRSQNTKPEVAVRKLLHAVGYRYRLGTKIGKMRPDIVLSRWKCAIFVHGCFWHGHVSCTGFRLPKSRRDFWDAKIEENRHRDKRTCDAIEDLGWKVIIVWECAISGKRRLATESLVAALKAAIHDQSAQRTIVGRNGTH